MGVRHNNLTIVVFGRLARLSHVGIVNDVAVFPGKQLYLFNLPIFFWRLLQVRPRSIKASKGEPLGLLRAGSGVVRIEPLCFLAGCRTRRLNQV